MSIIKQLKKTTNKIDPAGLFYLIIQLSGIFANTAHYFINTTGMKI